MSVLRPLRCGRCGAETALDPARPRAGLVHDNPETGTLCHPYKVGQLVRERGKHGIAKIEEIIGMDKAASDPTRGLYLVDPITSIVRAAHPRIDGSGRWDFEVIGYDKGSRLLSIAETAYQDGKAHERSKRLVGPLDLEDESMVLLYAHYHRAGIRYADPEDDEG